MQHHEHHSVLDASDRFPTGTAGLPDAVRPEVVALSAGETFELEIATVAKQLGDATVRMLAFSPARIDPLLAQRE